MKKAVAILAFLSVLACASYYVTLHYFPNYVYHRFYDKVTSLRGESTNQFSIILAPDEDARLVVKPNPDFSYGSAFFDLSEGPLRLTGDMPDSIYWSVAIYQPNTVNFYIKNDQQYNSSRLDVVITQETLDGVTSEQITSPTQRGFILVRALIIDRTPEDNQRILDHLETLSLSSLED